MCVLTNCTREDRERKRERGRSRGVKRHTERTGKEGTFFPKSFIPKESNNSEWLYTLRKYRLNGWNSAKGGIWC